MQRIASILLLLTGPALSGCVAAAAIPVLAGGSMLGSDAVAGAGDGADRASKAPPPIDAAAPEGTRLVILDRTTLPPPSAEDVRAVTVQRIEARSFDAFYGYALAQASTDPLEAPMRSALLTSPGSLEPTRQDCGARKPVVLVDLDPGEALFDPLAAGHGSAALGEVLAVLRSRGLAIAWISGLAEELAPDVRARLAREGLDSAGADSLLLIDDAHATKQKLRAALAEEHCPVAIAGDAREDFDELFAYLKSPEAAFALNEMFGAGWFLTPNPID